MLVLTAPFLLTLIASAFRKYPFSGRLLLFLVPLLLLLLAEGVERVRIVLMRVNKIIAIGLSTLLIVYLFLNPIKTAFANVRTPPMGSNIKPTMAYISNNYLSGDLIYVYYGAGPAFKFYVPQYGFVNKKYIVGISSRYDPVKYLQDIDNLKGNQRVWIVFSHVCVCGVNEKSYIMDYLNKTGVKRGEFIAYGSSVYLYNMAVIP
jgi:hypothetical protein